MDLVIGPMFDLLPLANGLSKRRLTNAGSLISLVVGHVDRSGPDVESYVWSMDPTGIVLISIRTK